jgi:hypothetical protein
MSTPYKLEAGDIRHFLKPNAYFRHYRNKNLYRIIAISKDTESDTHFVTYRAMYDDGLTWTRPYDMFVSMVEVDGQTVPRFSPVFIQSEPLSWLERMVYKALYRFMNKRLASRPTILAAIRAHQDSYELAHLSFNK